MHSVLLIRLIIPRCFFNCSLLSFKESICSCKISSRCLISSMLAIVKSVCVPHPGVSISSSVVSLISSSGISGSGSASTSTIVLFLDLETARLCLAETCSTCNCLALLVLLLVLQLPPPSSWYPNFREGAQSGLVLSKSVAGDPETKKIAPQVLMPRGNIS